MLKAMSLLPKPSARCAAGREKGLFSHIFPEVTIAANIFHGLDHKWSEYTCEKIFHNISSNYPPPPKKKILKDYNVNCIILTNQSTNTINSNTSMQ